MLIIGHRGASGHEPENTLLSIRTALDMGADGIEIDVYAVGGELLVIHDDTLERTTNGHGRVEEQPLEYLRGLDAGRGEQIPTLREVLDLINRRAFLNIELKGPHTAAPVLALVGEYIDKLDWKPGDFLLSSFDLNELRVASGRGIPLGPLFGKPPADCFETAMFLEAWSIHTSWKHITEDFVENAHSYGLKVFAYTVNEPEAIEAMRSLCVDAIFTDYPDRAVQGRRPAREEDSLPEPEPQ